MTEKLLLKPSSELNNFSLQVLIEQEPEGKYQAIVLGLPECKAEGNTREEAIANLSKIAGDRLEQSELVSLEIQQQKPDRPALTVLIEQETEGKYEAMVLGLAGCKAEGNSREEVITNISLSVGDRLEKAELISLEIKPSKPEHPWMKFAGMYKDDPQFEQVVAFIEEDRRQLNAEMEEYYRKLDAEAETK